MLIIKGLDKLQKFAKDIESGKIVENIKEQIQNEIMKTRSIVPKTQKKLVEQLRGNRSLDPLERIRTSEKLRKLKNELDSSYKLKVYKVYNDWRKKQNHTIKEIRQSKRLLQRVLTKVPGIVKEIIRKSL